MTSYGTLQSNVPNVTAGFYSKMKEEIQYKFTEKDGLLASDYYGFLEIKLSHLLTTLHVEI